MLIANLFAAMRAGYFQLSINNVDDIYHKKKNIKIKATNNKVSPAQKVYAKQKRRYETEMYVDDTSSRVSQQWIRYSLRIFCSNSFSISLLSVAFALRCILDTSPLHKILGTVFLS